jgi:hypothetical protein
MAVAGGSSDEDGLGRWQLSTQIDPTLFRNRNFVIRDFAPDFGQWVKRFD